MRTVSFLHAADLHLDSPFRGITAESPEVAGRIRSSTFDAFDRLVEAALERRVDFVLVAGDVYDGADRSLRAQLRFRDGLARLAARGVRSFVVHGNHDPLDGWTSAIAWPDGVHVFGDAIEDVEVAIGGEPAAVVSGISYPKKNERRNLASRFRRAADGLFHVGLLHANVGADTGHEPYAPCELSELVASGVDYWALGHVHERAVLHRDPYVVYPGNIQGRHIRETGARGCVHVTVEGRRVAEVEFVPLDAVRWELVRVDVSGIAEIDALDDRLAGAVEAALGEADGRPLLCRVVLEGRGPLHAELARERASADLLERFREHGTGKTPFAWVQEISVETRPEVDLDERSRADDLLGQVLRISAELAESPDGHDRLYDAALARLYGNPRAARALDPPGHAEVLRMLEDAGILCLDRLEGAQ